MKIEKLVEVGEERNIIVEKIATSNLSLAKIYKRRSWLEAFAVEGISQELNKDVLESSRNFSFGNGGGVAKKGKQAGWKHK